MKSKLEITPTNEDPALDDPDRTPWPTGDEGVKPDHSHPYLLYRLLKLTNLIGRPFFTHFAERYDLTMNDLRILMTLAPMAEAASHELCQVTGMHPMNVSRSVARLRRQGRITERSDPGNRRRKILSPTDDGWALYESLKPHVKVLSEFLFSSLSPLEGEFMSKLVDLLSKRLEALDLNSPLLIDAQALAMEIAPDDASATAEITRRPTLAMDRSTNPGKHKPATS